MTSPMPKAASVAGDLPHLDLHIATCPVLEGASTQRLGPLERKSLASVLSGGSLQDMDSISVIDQCPKQERALPAADESAAVIGA